MHQNILRTIPSVNEFLESPEISKLTDLYPRQLVVDVIREVLENVRKSIIDKTNILEPTPQILTFLIQHALRDKFSGIERAINATGIILHTGLGRAPLADAASKQLQEVSKGFCTVEIEKHTGKRGIRYHTTEQLICMITGAEAALVVNNNAAAVLLTLDTLAREKEVVISRAHLVEIGGSFRMPDVMARSGAIMVEVGTTNKTYLKDYENAITENTGLILKVHQSNFKIVGFTETVALEDLVALGKTRDIPVMYDLGSGALIDLQKFGLPHEPTVQESMKAGADIVTFSTDKLLGGPQGGIVVGKKKWINLLEKNPLLRAFRVGKLTIAALEATLKLYLDEGRAAQQIPVLKMILASPDTIDERRIRLTSKISTTAKKCLNITLINGFSGMGGGSLPGEEIPTKLVSLHSDKISVEEIAARLRENTPPIFARIEQDCVLLDMRTVYDEEVDVISCALENICSS
jgi:L-seryl-tRNA(Ser) seleniumtransferase